MIVRANFRPKEGERYLPARQVIILHWYEDDTVAIQLDKKFIRVPLSELEYASFDKDY